MKELKSLNINSSYEEFIECYNHNSKLVGSILIRNDIYTEFIKILTAFPLEDKKLIYFLKLSPYQKVGYMSSYIMKIAKKINIPNSVIYNFNQLKNMKKIYINRPSTEEVGMAFNDDVKLFFKLYTHVIKDEVYSEELSKSTISLCYSILQQYDKARQQMYKEQQLY